MTLYFYWTRIYRLIIIALLVTGVEAQAQCQEKTEAAVAIGDIVHFYYCDTPGGDQIGVGKGPDQFLVDKDTWQQGWSWKELSDGTSYYFHVIRNITLQTDFETTVISLPLEGVSIAKTIEVTVFEEAAPQLCLDEKGDPENHLPYIVTVDFGASVESTLCILSLDESATFDVSPPVRVSDNIDPGYSSSFTVSVNAQPETGGYFEQELVFSVTDMSVACVGSWTVDVANGVGSFTVNVTIQATVMEAQTECSPDSQLESSGPIGESVYFYICGAAFPGASLVFDENSGDFSLPAETLADGWYWESVGSGAGSYINIIFTIAAAEDFKTYRLSYTSEDLFAVTRTLTVSHQGPPQLCSSDDRDNPEYVKIISENIGSTVTSTLCVVSQTEPNANTGDHTPFECQEDIGGSFPFNVRTTQDSDNPVVYDLVFEVTSLSDEDIGTWTVNVTNRDGTLTVDLLVLDNGPSLCGTDFSKRLQGNFYTDVTSSVFIFTTDNLTVSHIYVERSPPHSSCEDKESCFVVEPLTRHDPTDPQELLLKVSNLTEAEVGNWTVTVTNSFGSLQFGVIIEATGPLQLCSGENNGTSQFVYANVGSSGNSTLCVLSPTQPEFDIFKQSASNCKVGTLGPTTFNVTAGQDSCYPVVYVLVFEVTSLSDEDTGQWTVDVSSTDGTLALEVVVVDNGPSLCVENSSLIIEGNFYTMANSSVYVSTVEQLVQSDIALDYVSPWNTNGVDSTFSVEPLAWDSASLLQELVLQVTRLTEADIGNWTVTVQNIHNSLDFNITVLAIGPPQVCETEDPSGDHTLSTAIGSSESSTLCVVSGSALTLSKVQPQACQGKTTDTSTFDVTAVQNTSNPVVYELEFSVSNLTVADIGQWTVNVDNDDSRLTIVVNVEAVGSPTVCDASQDLNLYLECEGSTTRVFIFSQDALEVGELTSVENSSCTSSLGVSVETKDANSLTQELVVTATCDKASTWTVTVNNSYGELEIGVTVGNCTIPEARTPVVTSPEDQRSSVNWLAIGFGLTSLVIIIVVVVVIVFVYRRNKRFKKRPQQIAVKFPNNNTVFGEFGIDTPSTYQNIHLNGVEPTQQPAGTPVYDTINDADVEPTQSRSGPVVLTASEEYPVPDGGNLTSQAISDHSETTAGDIYVTMDSELPASNRSDHGAPTTSRYETVFADFPFTRATRTISGGTSDRVQPGMTSGLYDLCNSEDIEPPNVYLRMDNGCYVNHAIGRESGGARETYANVASAYENAA